MRRCDLSADFVRLLFEYDNGILRWREARQKGGVAGASAGNKTRSGYVNIIIDGVSYKAHRVVWLYKFGSWPKADLDHINGVRDDNRIENLRESTRSENLQNLRRARADNQSGYLGVRWHTQQRKWQARITVNGKQRHIGLFQSAEEAHQEYLRVKRESHSFCTI